MLFFFVCSAIIEKYKPKIGHETGLTIILGIVISLIIFACVGDKVEESFKFSQGLFFNFFLPPIIFNSGFNMRKKKFFNNLGNVMLFGLGTTIVVFIFYSLLGMVLLNMGPLMYNYTAINSGTILPVENPMPIEITTM